MSSPGPLRILPLLQIRGSRAHGGTGVSGEKNSTCKGQTPAEHDDLGEAMVLVPQLPCTVLKDTSRNSIRFLCRYSFMSLPSQDRSKVCNTAQGTSTPHFWLTSSAFSCCLFYELFQSRSKAHLFPAFSVPLALPFLGPEEMPFLPLLCGEVHLSFKA